MRKRISSTTGSLIVALFFASPNVASATTKPEFPQQQARTAISAYFAGDGQLAGSRVLRCHRTRVVVPRVIRLSPTSGIATGVSGMSPVTPKAWRCVALEANMILWNGRYGEATIDPVTGAIMPTLEHFTVWREKHRICAETDEFGWDTCIAVPRHLAWGHARKR